jgi:hypothetical protein
METTHVEAAVDSEQYLALIRRLAAAQGTATTSEIGEDARKAAVSEIENVMDAIRRSPFSLDQLGRVRNNPTSDAISASPSPPRVFDVVAYPMVIAKVVGVIASSPQEAAELASGILQNQIRSFIDTQPIKPDDESAARGEIAYVAYGDEIRDFTVEDQQPLVGEPQHFEYGVNPISGELEPRFAIERAARKESASAALTLQAVVSALTDVHRKLSAPNAVSSNIDEVRWAEAMQSLESLSGKDSGEYYDSVATKRPYLIQKCTQEVERGIVKTLGYRAVLNLSYSNGDLSTTPLFGCKSDALNLLEAAVASANDHVVDIQMGYPATPELLTTMSLLKAIQDRGSELPLSSFEVPGTQVETLPVKWRTWLNPDHQQHCDIELQG